MRLTTFAIVATALLTSAGPSYAAKYTCSFAVNSQPAGGTCSIEPGKNCVVRISGNEFGAGCGVGSASGNNEVLICVFFTPGESLAADEKKLGKMENLQAMAEQPGFLSGGSTIVA